VAYGLPHAFRWFNPATRQAPDRPSRGPHPDTGWQGRGPAPGV